MGEQAGDGVVSDDGVWSRAAASFTGWLDGDDAALSELVAVMTPVLWHVVRAYRLPAEAAEDVIQSTWLALCRRRYDIEDAQAVGGWLTTTARRAAWRAGKQLQVAERELADDAETLEWRTPAARSSESVAVEHDEQSRLWAAVGTLDERCRRLLRVVAFEQRPDYAGLSEELGMPVGSIGPTRGRCLSKLRSALDASGFHEEL